MGVRNQRGQGLIEYLIIVCLMAAATVGVVSVLSQNVRAQFSKAAIALGNSQKAPQLRRVRKDHYKMKDLGNFLDGARDAKDD